MVCESKVSRAYSWQRAGEKPAAAIRSASSAASVPRKPTSGVTSSGSEP